MAQCKEQLSDSSQAEPRMEALAWEDSESPVPGTVSGGWREGVQKAKRAFGLDSF